MAVKRIASLLFCAVILLVACAGRLHPRTPSEPPLPKKAFRIGQVPEIYRRWWREVEDCSGKWKPIESVTFYVIYADSNGFPWHDETGDYLLAGLAFPQKQAIVMGTKWAAADQFVRHEMLHLIASPHGHDPLYFKVLCADFVTCFGACAAEEAASDSSNTH